MDSTQNERRSSEPSSAPDFNQEYRKAQTTGDFSFVMDTAKKSHRMLTDFDDAIKRASYPGRDSNAIAMGLNFLANMIANSAGQLAALKQSEKQTREALKKAGKNKLSVVGPEEPEQAPEPPPEQPEPQQPADAPQEPISA